LTKLAVSVVLIFGSSYSEACHCITPVKSVI
jgi:hypothetical protein